MKGQISVEFMMIFLLMIAALTVAMLVGQKNMESAQYLEQQTMTNEILESVSDKINTAFMEGHGFSTNITLPQMVHGKNYAVRIRSNSIEINVSETYFYRSLLTQNITGSLSKGLNRISNVNGIVVIS